ncbi:MAG: DUF2088 domain-containing protein, partial [Candidatus Latescibacteria bacterium]|nr:DUF2088 domain-containing protein [Candidatus Latescibacterota bacterium]
MIVPKMVKIRQLFTKDRLENPAEKLAGKLGESGLLNGAGAGARIAVTAGSRGIHGIAGILRAITGELRRKGAQPFIVPAMGSHGGGAASGQVEMLESLGITEKNVGAPIQSSMETVVVGTTPAGVPVYMDKNAYESDGIVIVNRVKLHTAFHGPVESGLCKMVAVGLGKKRGAETMHRLGFDAMGGCIVKSASIACDKANIICGVAI